MATQTGSLDLSAAKKAYDAAQALLDEVKLYFWFTSTDPGSSVGAGAHITQVPQTSFVSSPAGGNVLIDSDSVDIRDGVDVLASFGSTGAVIGQADSSHAYMAITDSGIQGFNSLGSNVLDIDLSSVQVEVLKTIPVEYRYSGSGRISHTISELNIFSTGDSFKIKIKNGLISSEFSFTYGTPKTYYNMVEYDGSNIITHIFPSQGEVYLTQISYSTTGYAPAWTFGTRSADTKGAYSFTVGAGCSAQDDYSFAVGYNASAGAGAFACGSNCAAGYRGIALGFYAKANEDFSVAIGDNVSADTVDQAVFGRYNKKDTNGDYAFIIGNGESSAERTNALTVDWNGNVNIASGAKYKINDTALSASDVSAVALSDKYTRSSVGTLDWTNQTDGDAKVIAKSALAFWNGAYSGTSSNLAYCNKGAFGTLATKNSLSASDVGAVPTSRTVNSKALSANISLTASDVGAVPTSRTVNNKALSSNITLSASDVSAVPLATMPRGRSMVSTIPSGGQLTLNNTDIGGSSSAKIQCVLAIPQYGSGVIIKHNYDASSTSQCVLNFYKADGSAYSGAMRYFLITFPNSWG